MLLSPILLSILLSPQIAQTAWVPDLQISGRGTLRWVLRLSADRSLWASSRGKTNMAPVTTFG